MKKDYYSEREARIKLEKDISYISRDIGDIKKFMQKLDDKLELSDTKSEKD